jgi:hypothetical protein
MIRIETTAEFDADGRFTATGQAPRSVTPGSHRISILVEEPATLEPATPRSVETTESPLQWVDGLLVFTGEMLEDPDEVLQRLDDERMRQLLGELPE